MPLNSNDIANYLSALQYDIGFNVPVTSAGDSPWQITYQFAGASVPSDFDGPAWITDWYDLWSAQYKAAFRAALSLFEDVINVEFTEVTGQSDPDMNVGIASVDPLNGYGGAEWLWNGAKELTSWQSYVVFDESVNLLTNPYLLIHEIGHSLGLEHPHDGTLLDNEFDNTDFTMMSYNTTGSPNALGVLDILALQNIWGKNTSTGASDNSYSGPRNGSSVDSIYDFSGFDTFDGSGYDVDLKLDLREGAFSHFGTGKKVSIAFGTIIENARGGSASDEITGNSHANIIWGGEGDDVIHAGSGDDKVYSDKGADKVYLGDGDDYVRVGGGLEEFHGGAGSDYISYYASAHGVKVNLATNTVSGSWASNDVISGFENVSGSKAGNDTIYGTTGANKIKTYGGDDKIYAGSGADKVYAGKGSDIVELGAGNDYVKVGGGEESFDGGTGNDYISYYASTGGITIDLEADTVSRSWAVNDTIKDFESASGSKTGADKMYGTSGANTLKGYGGNDKLYGRSGNDKLYGGTGNDYFDGGAGTDLLYGGNGADVFHFDRTEDHDIIKDFQNNVDKIELDNFTFAAGQDAFDFATQVGTDVVFDFGNGDMLTVENTAIVQLLNDLVMV